MNEIEEETHTGKGQAINTDSLADNRDSPSSGCPRVFPSLTRFVDFFYFFQSSRHALGNASQIFMGPLSKTITRNVHIVFKSSFFEMYT